MAKTKRVAVLGTAADPITVAHQQLMTLARPHFDEVWVMPTYKHKFGKCTQDSYYRLRMCELAVEQIGPSWAKVSDFEIKHQVSGATIETIRLLKQHHPFHEFHWMIGMDNAKQIDKWQGFPGLLTEVAFVVFDRAGYTSEGEWWNHPPHIHLPGADWQVSSSEFRRLYSEHNKDAAKLVPFEVYMYIQANFLY